MKTPDNIFQLNYRFIYSNNVWSTQSDLPCHCHWFRFHYNAAARPEYVPTWQLLTRSHYARGLQPPKYTARCVVFVLQRDALHRERDSTCMRRIISWRIYAKLEYRSYSCFLVGIRAFGHKRRKVIARETRDTIAEKGRDAASKGTRSRKREGKEEKAATKFPALRRRRHRESLIHLLKELVPLLLQRVNV